MRALLNYLVLPSEITPFEHTYLQRVNTVALVFLSTHLVLFPAIALINGTGALLVAVCTAAVLAGPMLAWRYLENPRLTSVTFGVASMGMGAILVHAGQGPIQIEMHFYFFVLLALLAVFANPMAILAAAGTVAVHHAVFWLLLPQSVFNYDAPWWVVGVHALFVVLESAAAISIARGFFDNVVGLEKIVHLRTADLDARTREVRLMLDNAGQGFLMIDREGRVGAEKATILTNWFGDIEPGTPFAEVLGRAGAERGLAFELGWASVLEDVLPLDLAVDQLPRRARLDAQHFALHYTPIFGKAGLERCLIIVTDVSAEIEREVMEAEQRQILAAFERLSKDKAGFLEFWTDAEELLRVVEAGPADAPAIKRAAHTLKGNAAIFGLDSIAAACHRFEDAIAELGTASPADLVESWHRLAGRLHVWLGNRDLIEVEDEEFEAILRDLTGDVPREDVHARIAAWRLEPAVKRLARFADGITHTARRLGKEHVAVEIEADPVRFDTAALGGLWAAWVHLLRNAVDHGVEPIHEREASGKPLEATIRLSARVRGDELVLQIADDGPGVAWDKVAAQAKKRGLPYQTPADLEAAVFADGISTRDEVTATSGRGVGLAALRREIEGLEGTISLSSTESGTTFTLTLPAGQGWVDATAWTRKAA